MTPDTSVYFRNLPEVLIRYLSETRNNIRIAVCWFSHKGIFEVLLERLRAGVRVELVLEYDTQNIRANGLDFQCFIQLNGHFYAHCDAGLMHHKFALIDDRLLLTGSFNWTYNSNAENLIATNDVSVVSAFLQEFEWQKDAARRVFTIIKEEAKVYSSYPLFENTQFHLSDLRKKVSQGAGVWLIRTEKLQFIFRDNRLPFDPSGLLRHYWTVWRVWDEALFETEIRELKIRHPAPVIHKIYRWACRMKTGDLILATEGKNRLSGLGVVQSDPQRSDDNAFSSFRNVQWLKIFENEPFIIKDKVSAQQLSRYRGSGLRLLQEVFEKEQ